MNSEKSTGQATNNSSLLTPPTSKTYMGHKPSSSGSSTDSNSNNKLNHSSEITNNNSSSNNNVSNNINNNSNANSLYSSSPSKIGSKIMMPVRHGSYDMTSKNSECNSGGIPLYRSSSQGGKQYPSSHHARRVRSATALNQTEEARRHYGEANSSNNNNANGSLGIYMPRQRATSVGGSNLQKSPKSKLILTEEPGQIGGTYLSSSPSTTKFMINHHYHNLSSSSSNQNSPTRPIFAIQSSPITKNGPELRQLKMDNYRGTNEVYEDLLKTTDDFLQWMLLLDAGINQLLSRF